VRNYRCANCGEEFGSRNGHSKPNKADAYKYCSRECAFTDPNGYYQNRRKTLYPFTKIDYLNCSVCGKLFIRRHLDNRKNVTCSRVCYKTKERLRQRDREYNKHIIKEIKCKDCGLSFIPEYGSKRRTFCSGTCSRRYAARTHRGVHPEIERAKEARRHAIKLQRTPLWLDSEHFKQIIAFYKEAAKRTKEEGYPFHVDHIVPLRGKTVSGLHVPWNLQVLTHEENIRKGNKWAS
jgi:rubredoxin